jgi:ABC-type dipeptide/oligopeptide/nickel transport system ATPase component
MLEVKNLSVEYKTDCEIVKAVNNVSFSLSGSEILGLVGESGSGKSTIALTIMKLISNPGRIAAGEIIFNGQDILKMTKPELIHLRGAKISMIFQDPFTSLNPVFSIGDQVAEVIQLHQGLGRQEAWQKAVEMLEVVHINKAKERVRDYPHQFSGGMRQRVMIAMALACQPKILIADEPTTALDVTIQAEILKLLKEIQQKFNLSIIYITHNFGIIKQMCDRVVVIQKGQIVEAGETQAVFGQPKNEYTQKLINCLKVMRHVD